MKYLSVAIENSISTMDILYTYAYAGEDISIGDSVIIPFGLKNTKRKGYVFEIKEASEVESNKIKYIIKKEGESLSAEAVALCIFLKKHYLCRYIDAINCFLPVGISSFEDVVSVINIDDAKNFVANSKSPKRQAELIKLLLENDSIKKRDLKSYFGIDYSVIKAVIKKGLAVEGRVEKQRTPHSKIMPEREGQIELTKEQEKAFSQIKNTIDNNIFKTFLLHGVTGSGKTRVYMEAIQEALNCGKTAIMLVPEISLTIQAITSFRSKFGEEKVAVLHSKLSDGERYDEWMRIKRGEAVIVLGARSAIFAPVKNLGVIVMDEEHESSYKSDFSPKIETAELAEERAKINSAIFIMGSATPSVTSYYRSEKGEIERLELKNRYNQTVLPEVYLVDMREELEKGNKNIFSVKLYEEMIECLKNHRQIILFLNRRGYSSFVSCRSCGYVMKCPECGVTMIYHKSDRAVVCHYCGKTVSMPKTCPECGSKYIKDFGVGTEKVEEICRKLFPNNSIARLDLDTVRKKGSAENILNDFKNKKTDILIGTQLVAKGLDFANVDLVGIIAADISLNIPDFRSAERTFQLVTQASGRSGRGEKRGKVVTQSYSPEHYALQAAKSHDYESFYRNEIAIRENLCYPPFSQIIQLYFLDRDENAAYECAADFCDELKNNFNKKIDDRILGPQPTHIVKVRGRYRYQILIKCKNDEITECIDTIENIRSFFASEKHRSCLIGLDINPYSLG